MPRPLAWRQLLPGIAILATIVLAAAAVLIFARVGSLHGDTYRLFILADEARGVIGGTEVWLAGQKVGAVRDVSFRPVSDDSLGRLVVALDILESYKPVIRGDSHAELRNGGTPIGATIVSISAGSPNLPALEPDDTIPRARQIDPDSVRAALSAAASQIPELLGDAGELVHTIKGAFGPTAGDSTTRLSVIASRVGRLTRRLDAGGGSLSRIAADTAMAQRMSRISARAEAIMRASDSTTLGRVVRDSALSLEIAALRGEIATLREQLDDERGTAGRLAHDDALLRQLRLLEARLDGSANEAGGAPRVRSAP